MPSPFPGMDPWLEQHWGDVHTRIVTYASDRLQTALPEHLRARVEERVYLEFDEVEDSRSIVPDIALIEYPAPGGTQAAPSAVATLVADEPIYIKTHDTPNTERFIEIRDFRTGGRLVTVIEVQSPANRRPGHSRNQYLRKREELRDARVHLVEIDLLRAGEPLDVAARDSVEKANGCTYLITVTRHDPQPMLYDYELYPIFLNRRLPVIRIPLRAEDPDVLLDVQALLNDAYDRGGYDIIDYNRPPVPPLPEAESEWARQLLSNRTRT